MKRVAMFDLETAPNPDLLPLALGAAKAREASRKSVNGLETKDSSPPGIEGEISKEMALSPLYGRIVAVGVLDADFGEPLTWVGEDEAELLRLFWENAQGFDLFVSFNGLAFDLPWLYVRSMVNSVQPTVQISTARYRAPGESNHLDLFALLTDWRGNRTRHLKLDLPTVAQALGVEPPVGEGAAVPKLFEAGDFEPIREHLESDLRATLGIWERLGCPGRPTSVAAKIPF